MKKIEKISNNPIVVFIISVFDLLFILIFLIKITKNNDVMKTLDAIIDNLELILLIIAIIVTTWYIFHHRWKKRRNALINDLKSLNIRLKLIQARLNSINDIRDFRREDIYPSEIKRLLTDEEILELKKHDYSDDTIKRILNAVVAETINK